MTIQTEDLPINCLLEQLLYFGTRLSSGDGPKVSIGALLSVVGTTFHVALLTAFWVEALAPLSVLGHSKSR